MTRIYLLVALVCAALLGVWYSSARFLDKTSRDSAHRSQKLDGQNSSSSLSLGQISDRSLIVQGKSTVNLGQVLKGTSKSHLFQIKNPNSVPVRLISAGSSCKCTTAKILDSTIPPNSIGRVEVTYTATSNAVEMKQSVQVVTDSQVTPELQLNIEGLIAKGILMDPAELKIREQEGAYVARGNLIRFCEDATKIQRIFWGDAVSQQAVQIDFKGREPSANESKIYADAREVFEVEVRFSKEFPRGPVHGILTVGLSSGDEYTFDVIGTIGDDAQWIAGEKFDESKNYLHLGRVPSGTTKSYPLFLALKCDQAVPPEISVELDESDSKILRVETGTPNQRGRRTLYPIKIHVLESAPAGFMKGKEGIPAGKIRVKTSLESIPEVSLQYSLIVD